MAARRVPSPSTPARTGGKPAKFDLLQHNLGMAAAVEEYLSPAYGPGGRAKLFLDPKGRPLPTTDGAGILRILDSPHPVGKVVAAAAAAQDEDWKDGTKLVALLALRLLRRAGPLLEHGIRPPRIVGGYEIGLRLATEAATEVAVESDPFDGDLLLGVAMACVGGWLDPGPREALARAVVQGATQVATATSGRWLCDRADVHVVAKATGGFSVQRIDGYVLEQSREDPRMPGRVEDARIALFDASPIRGKAGIHEPRLRWVGEAQVRLKSPAQLDSYAAFGEGYTEEIVAGLQRAGANVVLCTLGISDYGRKLLADAGILGIRRIMKTRYLDAVARATGGSLIKDFREVRADQLGHAGLVEERRLGSSKCLIIDRCTNPKVVTLLISGPGEAAAEQYRTLASKAIGAVTAAIEHPQFLPGGAGAEMAAAVHVRREASRIEGREQLAVEAFGRSLEDLASCLATNMGLKPLDATLALRAACAKSATWGLLAGEDGPVDIDHGLFREPLALRVAAWKKAVEAAVAILRADDFHKTGRPKLASEKVAEADEGREPISP